MVQDKEQNIQRKISSPYWINTAAAVLGSTRARSAISEDVSLCHFVHNENTCIMRITTLPKNGHSSCYLVYSV